MLRIRDIYTGSLIQKQQQKRGVKKNLLSYLFLYPQISQNKIFSFLKCWSNKFGTVFKELLNFIPKNLSLSSQKYGWGPRSGIWKKPIPDPGPGVKKAPDPAYNTAYNYYYNWPLLTPIHNCCLGRPAAHQEDPEEVALSLPLTATVTTTTAATSLWAYNYWETAALFLTHYGTRLKSQAKCYGYIISIPLVTVSDGLLRVT